VLSLAEAANPAALWHVLHTKSRQEKALARELASRGIAHFLPLARHNRYHGGRKAVVDEPLFPGYVFLLGTADDAYAADRTRRVANLIRVPDQRKLDWELFNLQLAVAGAAPLDPYPYLTRGRQVEIVSGPFRGVQGLIEDRAGDRLILQVDVLGQAVSLRIDGAQVEPID
jgi:transcription antitermination factor NusG